MSKRSRISEEDRALFRQAAGEVRRMEDDRAYPPRTRSTSRPRDRTLAVRPTDSRGRDVLRVRGG